MITIDGAPLPSGDKTLEMHMQTDTVPKAAILEDLTRTVDTA